MLCCGVCGAVVCVCGAVVCVCVCVLLYTQLVEMEERQRKTFLLPEESARLHASKDGEDWKELEGLKGGDAKLREKLKDVQKEQAVLLVCVGL